MSRHFAVRKGFWDPETAVLKAVDQVNLSVRTGETMGLVGESGCGKSTLGRMVVRLLRPTSGSVLLEGKPVWGNGRGTIENLPEKAQMIFQDPYSSLNPRRTIGSAIGEALYIHKRGNRRQRRERVAELLELVGMQPDNAKRYPHEFSGGQRQRIAIARALALSPDLVVCDEPVSALDVSIQAQVLNLLEDLQQRMGLTYLFISHDLSVVSHVSGRVAVMYLGRIVELAEAAALYAGPLHPYTWALLESLPEPDPGKRKQLKAVSGDIPSPVNPPEGCPFHPRCPKAFEPCDSVRPEWRDAGDGHFVACHLYK